MRELRGHEIDAKVLARIQANMRDQARRLLLIHWQKQTASPSVGHRTVEAIYPCLPEWMGRKKGLQLFFRMTQVLFGHGCFGVYLHRIGRERTMVCHHCGAPRDNPDYILVVCPT